MKSSALYRRIKGFTLTELIVAMMLFTLVMAVSGAAMTWALDLCYKLTARTTSIPNLVSINDFMASEMMMGNNIDFTRSIADHDRLDKYSDSLSDVIIHVHDNKFYLVENGIEDYLFDSNSGVLHMSSTVIPADDAKGTPNRAVFVVTDGDLKRTFTTTDISLSDEFIEENGGNDAVFFEGNYYICIDHDPKKADDSGNDPGDTGDPQY